MLSRSVRTPPELAPLPSPHKHEPERCRKVRWRRQSTVHRSPKKAWLIPFLLASIGQYPRTGSYRRTPRRAQG